MSTVLICLVAIAVAAAAWIMLQPMLRSRRRIEIAQQRLSPEQVRWLTARMPPYARLPRELRERLHGLIQIFIREKQFVGCDGLVVTDEMRTVIAGFACLLAVNRPDAPRKHFYDDLLSILVYPTAFVVRETHHDDDGLVTESEDVLSGQAWDASRIILSWQDIIEGVAGEPSVALHEFAHYLDLEDETMDGAPGLGDARAYAEWSETFWDEYDRLCEAVDAGTATFLDPYAATEPAEFFAVVTEAFFIQPRELLANHPALYAQLQKYYRVDPAGWRASEEAASY